MTLEGIAPMILAQPAWWGEDGVSESVVEKLLVRVEDLALRFAAGVQALAGVELSVEAGEFVAIVGPSGCGKSTLLRVLAGLIEPTGGRVAVDGMAPVEARRRLHELAFVFQHPTLLPWRTVLDNLRLPLELGRRRGSNAVPREELLAALARVGLRDFARAWPHQLSGGMQMRLSLARALVTDPRLLLLDEPFGALDDLTRQRLNEELLRLWLERGWTGLFVTHNVAEAVFLSRRVLVMSPRPGRFVAEVAVPFGYPRSPALRGAPEFGRLVAQIGERLMEPAG